MHENVSLLGKLRAKPYAYRQRVALATAFTLTSMVFLFWFSSFFVGSSAQNTGEQGINNVAAVSSSSPLDMFGALGAGIAGLWHDTISKFEAVTPATKIHFESPQATSDTTTGAADSATNQDSSLPQDSTEVGESSGGHD